MILMGIDYSLTSPAITVHEGDEWSYDNCTFYFLKASKPFWSNKYRGKTYPTWHEAQQRYQRLTEWTLNIARDHKVEKAYIEDYAFAAKGLVFNIAENTGLMKYGLWASGIPFHTFAPTAIKKFATGKGNSGKEGMVEAFKKDTGVSIYEAIGVKETNTSPSSDIVDSYWTAKYGHTHKTGDNP